MAHETPAASISDFTSDQPPPAYSSGANGSQPSSPIHEDTKRLFLNQPGTTHVDAEVTDQSSPSQAFEAASYGCPLNDHGQHNPKSRVSNKGIGLAIAMPPMAVFWIGRETSIECQDCHALIVPKGRAVPCLFNYKKKEKGGSQK